MKSLTASLRESVQPIRTVQDLCEALQSQMTPCQKCGHQPHVFAVFANNESNEIIGFRCMCLECNPNPTQAELAALPIYKTDKEMIDAWEQRNK